jgi:hypothetical protein
MGLEKMKQSLLNLMSKKDISLEDIELMFVRARLILEKLNIKHEYPQLNFYCDWVVHPEINRPNKVIDLILNLNQKILRDYGLKKEINIHSLIEPDKLWNELNMFFVKVLKSNNHKLDKENWSKLFYGLCHILSNRPLKIPENPPKIYADKIEQIKNFNVGQHIVGITSFELEINDGTIEGIPKDAVMWKAMAMNDNLIISGQL